MKLGRLLVYTIAAMVFYSLIWGDQVSTRGTNALTAAQVKPLQDASATGSQPTAPAGDKATADAYAHLTSKIEEAINDPIKVVILECSGVQVFKAPQPEGHPPPAEACQHINGFIKARYAENPSADIVGELRTFLAQQRDQVERAKHLETMRQALAELPTASAPASESSD